MAQAINAGQKKSTFREFQMTTTPFLFGSTFPLSFVRRPVSITPRSLDDLKKQLKQRECHSFWGHANTIAAAKNLIGHDVAPAEDRPALSLSPEGLPVLNNNIFKECWILSPDYVAGFRPAVGKEVPVKKILGWQVLQLLWNDIRPLCPPVTGTAKSESFNGSRRRRS